MHGEFMSLMVDGEMEADLKQVKMISRYRRGMKNTISRADKDFDRSRA